MKLSLPQRRNLSRRAGILAEDAYRGIPDAAEECRKIMRILANDRQLVIG